MCCDDFVCFVGLFCLSLIATELKKGESRGVKIVTLKNCDYFCDYFVFLIIVSKFICSRIKKRREPRVTVVTLKLCGDRKSLNSLYERHPTCAA
jgi:hypothetical protein